MMTYSTMRLNRPLNLIFFISSLAMIHTQKRILKSLNLPLLSFAADPYLVPPVFVCNVGAWLIEPTLLNGAILPPCETQH